MKKFDFIMIFFLVMLSLSPLLFISNSNGYTAEITVDGKPYKTLSLNENTELSIITEHGENTIIVKDKKIFVKSADCKDGVCVKTGAIHKPGEVIACLPHKLLIEIKGEK